MKYIDCVGGIAPLKGWVERSGTRRHRTGKTTRPKRCNPLPAMLPRCPQCYRLPAMLPRCPQCYPLPAMLRLPLT
jgi:hypothetical protein